MAHPNAGVVEALRAAGINVVIDGEVRVFLTRRNLETLISKLDANKAHAGTSACTLVKQDVTHPRYPQTHPTIVVKALEDDEYYTDREPGRVRKFDA